MTTPLDAAYLANTLHATGLTADRFARWRKALGRVHTGEADAKILCIGDSITWGHTYEPGTDSYPARLAALLNSYRVPAVVGLAIPPMTGHVDSRFAVSGSWNLSNIATVGFGIGANYRSASVADGGSGALTYTPGTECDTFDIYWAGAANTGTVEASIDGGAVTSAPTAGADRIGITTISTAPGSGHVLTLGVPTGGTTYIVGIEAYLSTDRKVRVGNAGCEGNQTGDWIGTTGNGALESVRAYAPDLTVILLSVNDAVAGIAAATVQANLSALIPVAQESGDVIVMTPPPSGEDPAMTNELAYRSANVYGNAADAASCALLDLFERWGSYSALNPLGYYEDPYHPTKFGYVDMAENLMRALASI